MQGTLTFLPCKDFFPRGDEGDALPRSQCGQKTWPWKSWGSMTERRSCHLWNFVELDVSEKNNPSPFGVQPVVAELVKPSQQPRPPEQWQRALGRGSWLHEAWPRSGWGAASRPGDPSRACWLHCERLAVGSTAPDLSSRRTGASGLPTFCSVHRPPGLASPCLAQVGVFSSVGL